MLAAIFFIYCFTLQYWDMNVHNFHENSVTIILEWNFRFLSTLYLSQHWTFEFKVIMTLILILGHWHIGCKCGVGCACSMKDILHRAQSFHLSSFFLFLPVFPLVSLQVCARSGATRWRWSLLKPGRKWRFRGRSCSGWTLPDSVKSKIWQISHASMRPLSYTIYERDTIQDSYMWVFPFSQSCFPHVFRRSFSPDTCPRLCPAITWVCGFSLSKWEG